jgi:hypothetical protein
MFNISFDFDESTHKVTNVKVVEKELTFKSNSIQEYDLEVLPGKIQLGENADKKLGVVVGDRISINY